MIIREYIRGEELALRAVFLSAIRKIASRDYSPEQVEAWAPLDIDMSAWVDRISRLRPFVVTDGNIVVAYADIQPNGYIDHFYVSGDHPRKGIGRLLMTHIMEEAKTRALPRVFSQVSITAQPFFERFGFVVVRRQTVEVRGVWLDNALMEKAMVVARAKD